MKQYNTVKVECGINYLAMYEAVNKRCALYRNITDQAFIHGIKQTRP